MKKILVIFILIVNIFYGCESSQIKQNRKAYKQFLYEMSDKPEYLEIKSEKVKIVGQYKLETYFYVDFETRYCDKILKDRVEFYFLRDKLTQVNGKFPMKYKTDYLLKVLNI